MSIRQYIDNMTPERILQLAAREQGFSVHRYRYRDEQIARRVRVLVKEGKLRRVEQTRESCTYRAIERHKPAPPLPSGSHRNTEEKQG